MLGPFALFAKHLDEQTAADRHLADAVLDRYVGGTDNFNAEHIFNISDMLTDAFFWFGVDRFVQYQVEFGQRNTFQYLNHHKNDAYHVIDWAIPGVSHADELYLMWNPLLRVHFPLIDEADIAVSKHMTTMWSNFVKFGNPTPPGQDKSIEWEPVSKTQKKYLRIQKDPAMEHSQEYSERMEFWYNLGLN